MSISKKLEWEKGLTSNTWTSLTAIEKRLFFVAAKDNDKFYWMCFNVDNSLISRTQLNATTPLFDTLEEARESAQSYFENIYSRFYGEPDSTATLALVPKDNGDIGFRVCITQPGEYKIDYDYKLKRVSIMRMPIV